MRVTFNSFYDIIAQTHEAIDPALVLSCLNSAIREVNASGLTMQAEQNIVVTAKTNDVNDLLIAPTSDASATTYLGDSCLDIIGIDNPSGIGMEQKSMEYLDRFATESEPVYWNENNLIKFPLIAQTINMEDCDTISQATIYMYFTSVTDGTCDFLDDILPLNCNVTTTVSSTTKTTYGANLTLIVRDEDAKTLQFGFDKALTANAGTITSMSIIPIYSVNHYLKIAELTVSAATPAVQNTVYIPARVFDIVLNRMYANIYESDKYFDQTKLVNYITLYNNAMGIKANANK